MDNQNIFPIYQLENNMKNLSFTLTTADTKYTLLENKPIKKFKGRIKTYKSFIGLIKILLRDIKEDLNEERVTYLAYS